MCKNNTHNLKKREFEWIQKGNTLKRLSKSIKKSLLNKANIKVFVFMVRGNITAKDVVEAASVFTVNGKITAKNVVVVLFVNQNGVKLVLSKNTKAIVSDVSFTYSQTRKTLETTKQKRQKSLPGSKRITLILTG